MLHSRILKRSKRSKSPRNNKPPKNNINTQKIAKKLPANTSIHTFRMKHKASQHSQTGKLELKSFPSCRGFWFFFGAPLLPLSSSEQPWLHSKPQPQWPEAVKGRSVVLQSNLFTLKKSNSSTGALLCMVVSTSVFKVSTSGRFGGPSSHQQSPMLMKEILFLICRIHSLKLT